MAIQQQHNKVLPWTLFLTVFLFVFAKFSEPGLGISSTTYGALARDIVDNHHWFNPTIGYKMNDPLVDHPYFILWLDALVFKLFGFSAQTVRLVSSVMGLLGFVALFSGVKNLIDEKVAYLSCVLLMTINVYMNYHSSGWMDLPMVCFCLYAFYFVSKEGFNVWRAMACGLMISFAVLSKGAGALAIFPIFLFALFQSKHKVRDFFVIGLSSLAPFLLFTWAHYQSQGFLFWTVYFHRQFGALNNSGEQGSSSKNYFWYLLEALRNAHFVAVLCLPGIWLLFKRGQKKLAGLIFGVLLIHFLAYSISSRHYGQYVLPIYPWMAVATAFLMVPLFKQRFKVQTFSKFMLTLALVYFVVIDILPVQVHGAGPSEGVRIKSLQRHLYFNQKIHTVYFQGDLADQDSWEGPSSYIRWYLNKWPISLKDPEMKEKLASLKDDEVALVNTGFSSTPPCMHNSELDVYAKNCADLDPTFVEFHDQNQYLP